MLPTLLLSIFFSINSSVSGQCFGGVETYEKTAGTTVICSAADGCNSRGLLTQPDTSVTRDCIAICKQSSACNIFTVGEFLFFAFFFFKIKKTINRFVTDDKKIYCIRSAGKVYRKIPFQYLSHHLHMFLKRQD